MTPSPSFRPGTGLGYDGLNMISSPTSNLCTMTTIQNPDDLVTIVQTSIRSMLEDIGFDPLRVPFDVDGELEAALHLWLEAMQLSGPSLARARRRVKISADLTIQCFTNHTPEVRIEIGKYCLAYYLIDDLSDEFMHDLILFNQR